MKTLLVAIGLLLVVAACRGEEPLPVLWPAPSVSLIDQQGRPFTSADLTGRATLMSFIYTLSKRNVSLKVPLTLVLLAASFAAGAFLGLNVAVITLIAGLVGILCLAPRPATPKQAEEAAR